MNFLKEFIEKILSNKMHIIKHSNHLTYPAKNEFANYYRQIDVSIIEFQ